MKHFPYVHIPLACTSTDIDECSPEVNPCQNQGVCLNRLGNYSCDCVAGFEGQHCDQGKISYIIQLLSKLKQTPHQIIFLPYKIEQFRIMIHWSGQLGALKGNLPTLLGPRITSILTTESTTKTFVASETR